MLVAFVALGIAGEIMVRRAGPILKARVIETLATRFNAHVELDNLNVSLLHGVEVSGDGLRIAPPDEIVQAEAAASLPMQPIIAVRHFSFHASLRGVWLKPTHVSTVYVSGLEIHIPPRQVRESEAAEPVSHRGKIEIVVDHFLCEDSHLVIENADQTKEPKTFTLQRIILSRIGPGAPLSYDATLINAIPRGNVHATGEFGPWVTARPGDSSISGHYTFDHADLDPIRGIGGTLSSVGDYHGQLNRIAVAGTADVPNFSLDSASKPVPLHTEFSATVDGTTGDTYLDSVHARLRNTAINCTGSIVNIRGVGHTIDLDVDIPGGRLEDLLDLAVKTRPVYLTARISTHAKLHIDPGKESVTRKLSMKGGFKLQQVHFTNAEVQTKVDELSLRAQGRPAEATPDAPTVASQMTGQYVLRDGSLNFSSLDFNVPGASAQLTGIYSLDGQQFDFHGVVRTEARASEMVSKWWKQLLLKPLDGFLAKDGAGVQLPVHISGTKSAPKFGLDWDRMESGSKPAAK